MPGGFWTRARADVKCGRGAPVARRTRTAHCRAMRVLFGHVRVFAVAAAFGLAAYAAVSLLVWISRRVGLLERIAG
jgi:hypothetical protein